MKKSSSKNKKINIVEVGPRDGLQNEKKFLDVDTRVEFARRLTLTGIKTIEVGAFVSPQKVPQMADSKEVLERILKIFDPKKINFPVLVPNEHGMQDAIEAGAREVAIFTACSEKFNQANINCSIEESFERFKPVLNLAKKNKIRVRGYLSTAFYCPYEGKMSPKKAIELSKRLLKLGCYEVSIGDTLGAATPNEVSDVLKGLKKEIGAGKIAMHFHDTRGTALANILRSFELGVRTFDSSLGGLGGCPYAPGAQGNVSTEDVVYMFHGMGLQTGIDLQKLIEVSQWMTSKMDKVLATRVGKAGLPKS